MYNMMSKFIGFDESKNEDIDTLINKVSLIFQNINGKFTLVGVHMGNHHILDQLALYT